MLQQTITRLAGIEHIAPIVICNEEYRFLAAEQLHALKSDKKHAHNGLILEPFGRNTAPAIALAALKATRRCVLVLSLNGLSAINEKQQRPFVKQSVKSNKTKLNDLMSDK